MTPTLPEVLLGEGGATDAGWHSIESMFRCPKEYQYENVRKIRPIQRETPEYFAIGLVVHAMRARWFARRFATDQKTWESMREAAEAEAEKQPLPISREAMRRAMIIMQLYVEHWSQQARPTPVAAEHLIGPSALVEGDPFMLWRTARLDDVSRYPGSNVLWIGECKTTSTSIDDVHRTYELHGQPLLQMALYKMAPQGERQFGPVSGVMLDVIKKPYGKDKAKFARVPVPVPDRALAWFVKNLRHVIQQAAQVDWDTEVPRNISACTRMMGRMRVVCPMRDLCKNGRNGALKYVMGKEGKALTSWRPSEGQLVAPWE